MFEYFHYITTYPNFPFFFFFVKFYIIKCFFFIKLNHLEYKTMFQKELYKVLF